VIGPSQRTRQSLVKINKRENKEDIYDQIPLQNSN